MSQLLLVHLATGEDVIGKTRFDAGTSTYHIEDPVSPHMSMDPSTGSVRVGLMPVRPFADENLHEIKVSMLHVVYVASLSEQMQNAYTQFTSDIVIPDNQSLSSLLKG